MSYIKRWIEDHIDEIGDEDLLSQGIDQETIDLWRESFGTKK